MLFLFQMPARADDCPCVDIGLPAPWAADLSVKAADLAYRADNSLQGAAGALARDAQAINPCTKTKARFELNLKGVLLVTELGPPPPITVPSYSQYKKIRDAKDSKAFDGSSDDVLNRWSKLFADDPTWNASRARAITAFHQLLYTGDENQTLALANKLASHLSEVEKIEVVRMMDIRGYGNYDKLRADSGPHGGGVVSFSQMLDVSRKNLDNGKFFLPDPERLSAGVCRDIALNSVKLARALGMPNSYAIQSTRSEGSPHVAVFIQDSKGRAHLIVSGFDRTIEHLEGGATLRHNQRDIAANFGIVNSDGRTVSRIPSEIGKALILMTGNRLDEINPMERSSTSIVRMGDTAEHSGATHSGGIVYAHNATEEWGMAGLTYRGEARWNKYLKSSVAAFTGILTLDRTEEGAETAKNLGAAYLRLDQHARTGCVTLGNDEFCGRLEANLNISEAAYRGLDGAKEFRKITFDKPDSRLKAGAVFEAENIKAGAKTWLGCTVTYGTPQVADRTAGFIPVLDNCGIVGEGHVRAAQGIHILAGSALLHYPGLNTTVVQAQAGLGGKNFRATAGIEGRTDKDQVIFVAGARQKAFLNLGYFGNLGRHPVDLLLSFTRDLEMAAEGLKPPMNVFGTINFQTNE